MTISWDTLADDLRINATVDKTVIGLNQQFTLNIELSGEGANKVSNPEVPMLNQFANFLGSGSSQNIQFINGKMSVSKTISYHFRASSIGNFKIPSITVTYKGKQVQSEAINIEIVQNPGSSQKSQKNKGVTQGTGPAEGDLFLRVEVNKKRVYQNEPVIVTFKIYTQLNISQFGYLQLPETAGFWAEEFDLPQQPQTHKEILQGKEYLVATIKKMALFPTSSGPKTISSMGIECAVRMKRRRSHDPFQDFFDDSFFFGRTERKEVFSKPLTITVNSLPDDGKHPEFSGIVGQYKISDSVDKTQIKTNEAITYKLTVEGTGNIRTLPNPNVSFSPDFEVYPPKISESVNRKGEIISGKKSYEYVLIPRVPGAQKIHPVILHYFNPNKQLYERSQTKERIIQVAKGDEVMSFIPSGLSKEEVKLLSQDIRFIHIDNPKFKRRGVTFYTTWLFWFILIFPLTCVGLAMGYGKHLNRLEGDIAYARGKRASRMSKRRLARAKFHLKESSQKLFYAEVGKALMGYLGDKLNIAEAGLISDEVKTILKKREIQEEIVKNIFHCLDICDMKRFAPAESTVEEMNGFLKQAEEALTHLDRALK